MSVSGVPDSSGAAALSVGAIAPDFTLRDTHGTPITLSDLRGAPVLIVFYPFAFSGICSGELCELRDNLSVFNAADVRVLAISCDTMFSLKAWTEQEGFAFDLLSDFWPHGDVARAYGVFDDDGGLALRGSFLIDADGALAWSVVNGRGERRKFTDYQDAVARLTASA